MKKHTVAIVLFSVLIIVMTYPLVFRITTHIPGFFSSDELYAPIWHAWWFKFSFLNGLSAENVTYLAYPFGRQINLMFGYLFVIINYILAITATHILTYNIQVIANFFLNAFFTYLLTFHITKNRLAAFLSGTTVGFCPYMFARSWQHITETYLWMLPFVLWAMLKLKDRPAPIFKIAFVLSIFLTSINFGAVYYTLVIVTVFVLYSVFYIISNRRTLTRDVRKQVVAYVGKVFFLGFIASLLLIAQAYPYIRQILTNNNMVSAPSGFNPYHRPFNDLFTQSAKPLSYFLPATVHPVFGKFTEQFIGSPLYGVSYTEHTLYLGWVPIILSFIAYRNWRKRRKNYKSEILNPKSETNSKLKISAVGGSAPGGQNSKQITNYHLPITDYQGEDFYIGFFIWLAVVAWLFSQPPYFTFPYFKIYMPSFFMYKILPMFRAYCRFGIVVMLAVAVLAGFGLKFILERFKTRKTRIAVTSLACALVLFEFLNFPPFKVIDLTKYPKAYDWLKGQKGDFAIAEYPLDVESPNEYYKFCQTIHEKKIINSTIPGTPANNIAKTIWRLSDPQTAGTLSWMDVKYVLVHLYAYERSDAVEIAEEFKRVRGRHLPGLKFLRNIYDVDVYEVTAPAVKPNIKE